MILLCPRPNQNHHDSVSFIHHLSPRICLLVRQFGVTFLNLILWLSDSCDHCLWMTHLSAQLTMDMGFLCNRTTTVSCGQLEYIAIVYVVCNIVLDSTSFPSSPTHGYLPYKRHSHSFIYCLAFYQWRDTKKLHKFKCTRDVGNLQNSCEHTNQRKCGRYH